MQFNYARSLLASRLTSKPNFRLTPDLVYQNDYCQVSVGAQVALNHATVSGDRLAAIGLVEIFYDNLFPALDCNPYWRRVRSPITLRFYRITNRPVEPPPRNHDSPPVFVVPGTKPDMRAGMTIKSLQSLQQRCSTLGSTGCGLWLQPVNSTPQRLQIFLPSGTSILVPLLLMDRKTISARQSTSSWFSCTRDLRRSKGLHSATGDECARRSRCEFHRITNCPLEPHAPITIGLQSF